MRLKRVACNREKVRISSSGVLGNQTIGTENPSTPLTLAAHLYPP